MNAAGRDMTLYGILTLKIGIDSIALDKQGKWLYYAPVSDDRFYRVATSDLENESLSTEDLSKKVEVWARKTLSDGITMDLDDDIYVSDMEHSGDPLASRGSPARDAAEGPESLRLADGFSFGPDGWLYVTCSALHQVILKSHASIVAHAPYQIFRFQAGAAERPRGQ